MSGDPDDVTSPTPDPTLALASCQLATLKPGSFSDDDLAAARKIALLYDCAKHTRFLGGDAGHFRRAGVIIPSAVEVGDYLKKGFEEAIANPEATDAEKERRAFAYAIWLESNGQNPTRGGFSDDDESNPMHWLGDGEYSLLMDASDGLTDEQVQDQLKFDAFTDALALINEAENSAGRTIREEPVPAPIDMPSDSQKDVTTPNLEQILSDLSNIQKGLVVDAESQNQKYEELARLKILELALRLSPDTLRKMGSALSDAPALADSGSSVKLIASVLSSVLDIDRAASLSGVWNRLMSRLPL
jgi:hypothetical protein